MAILAHFIIARDHPQHHQWWHDNTGDDVVVRMMDGGVVMEEACQHHQNTGGHYRWAGTWESALHRQYPSTAHQTDDICLAI